MFSFFSSGGSAATKKEDPTKTFEDEKNKADEETTKTGYHGLKKDSQHQDWSGLKADYHDAGEKGEVLVIDGHPVMEQWEKPYMEKLAEVATSKGGKVLEVGFGLGLSATAVQKYKIDEHIIIEANAEVVERGKKWAEKQPHKVTFLHGLWQDKVAELEDEYLDGVLYDTYPLNKEEQHIHQFDFIKKIKSKIKPGGVLTYCNLTSIGVLKGEHADWKELWEKTQVPHIKDCGFAKWSFTTFDIKAPDSCEYYAGHTAALVPKLETVTGYHGLKEDSKHEDWTKLKADYHTDKDKGEVLVIDGHPVMEQWEQPYMEKLAEVAASRGGKVLEVGFGLGLSATALQKHEIEEHIIIEANAEVIERGKKWAESQPHKVTFLHGLWQDKVAELPENHLDGVLYDTYPLNKEEQHSHQFDFIGKIYDKVKPGGILTYCNLTSIGVLKGEHGRWESVWSKTQVPLIRGTRWNRWSFKTFGVTPPDSCEYYSGHKEALVPRLEKRQLRKPDFISISDIQPDSRNLNLHAKLVSIEGPQALLADETGLVDMVVNTDEQKTSLSQNVGKNLYIRNAVVKMSRGYIKLKINMWGKVEPTEEELGGDMATENNISKVEYVLQETVEAIPIQGKEGKGKGKKGKGKSKGSSGGKGKKGKGKSHKGKGKKH